MMFTKYLVLLILFSVGPGVVAGETEHRTGNSLQLGVEAVRVEVEGLACPFCAYNIEKRVKTLEGVDRKAEFNVSVEKGVATFAWKPSVSFEPSSLNDQIRRAGFTPATIDLTVSGQLSFRKPRAGEKQGQMVLHLPKAKQDIALSSAERADRAESFSLLQRQAEHLGQDSDFAARMRATVFQTEPSWKLILASWEPITYGARVVIDVEKLACERCATGVMRVVTALKGVIHVEADHEENRTVVWTTEAKPNTDELKATVADAGFKVTRVQVVPQEAKGQSK